MDSEGPLFGHSSSSTAAASTSSAARFLGHTQVGEYELVDNHPHLATPHSPSTPDLLYPHTHLTNAPPAASLPINQNGLPVYDRLAPQPVGGSLHPPSLLPPSEAEARLTGGGGPDLDLDLERQHALFYSSDLLNSNISNGGEALDAGLDENLSHLGSADHLIHGGHGHFLSVNHSRTFLQGKPFFPASMS